MPTLNFDTQLDESNEDLTFEVFCGNCGAGLCGNCTEGKTKNRGMPFIQVEPCKKCLENAKDEGIDKGYEDGKKDGYDDGYNAGYSDKEKEIEVK